VIELDIIRVVCLSLIIAVHHASGYVIASTGSSVLPLPNPETQLAVPLLGLLVFVSGFALATAHPVLTVWSAARELIGKRLLRLYPLYAFALTLFLVAWYRERSAEWIAAQYGSVGLLAAGLVGPVVHTLWFVQLLLLYSLGYVFVRTPRTTTARGLTLASIMCAASVLTLAGLADPRLVLYVPAFVLGVYLAGRPGVQSFSRTVAVVGASALFVALYWLVADREIAWFTSAWILLLTTLPVLALPLAWWASARVRDLARGSTLFGFAACAGYCAYLTHRLVMGALGVIWEPSSHVAAIAWFSIVGLAASFAAGFTLQQFWDAILRRLVRRRNDRDTGRTDSCRMR
jgi:peptidoglycan/LPS O-acetylase OafA/YrhL